MAKTEPKETMYSFRFLVVPNRTAKKEYIEIESSGFSEKEALKSAVETAKEKRPDALVEYTGNFLKKGTTDVN